VRGFLDEVLTQARRRLLPAAGDLATELTQAEAAGLAEAEQLAYDPSCASNAMTEAGEAKRFEERGFGRLCCPYRDDFYASAIGAARRLFAVRG